MVCDGTGCNGLQRGRCFFGTRLGTVDLLEAKQSKEGCMVLQQSMIHERSLKYSPSFHLEPSMIASLGLSA